MNYAGYVNHSRMTFYDVRQFRPYKNQHVTKKQRLVVIRLEMFIQELETRIKHDMYLTRL